VADTATKPTAPVRDIAFQLPGTRGVEVRVTERAGEVKVEVRSGDAALTQDLRANLHELVSNLERKGLSGEVAHPADSPKFQTTETPSSKDSSGSQGNGSNPQEQQQDQRPHAHQTYFDGRSKKEREAAWNDLFDSYSEKREQ
jgi:hypothetical protein